MAEEPTKPDNGDPEEPAGQRTKRISEQTNERAKKNKKNWLAKSFRFVRQNWMFFTALLLAVGVLTTLVLVKNVFNTNEPSSVTARQVPFARTTATPEPTPVRVYEIDLEKQITDLVNYERSLAALMPPLAVSHVFVDAARENLLIPPGTDNSLAEIVTECNGVCAFEIPTPAGVKGIFLEAKAHKEDVANEAMREIAGNATTENMLFACQSGGIGVGVTEITQYIYDVVIVTFDKDHCAK